jgi:hypothetical protein
VRDFSAKNFSPQAERTDIEQFRRLCVVQEPFQFHKDSPFHSQFALVLKKGITHLQTDLCFLGEKFDYKDKEVPNLQESQGENGVCELEKGSDLKGYLR